MTDHVILLNEAEAIFFPAFDRHLCRDEEMTVSKGEKERQWDGLSFLGGREFEICWKGNVDFTGYDHLLCFLSVPPTARISGEIMTDGRMEPLFQEVPGDEVPLELNCAMPPFQKGMVTEIRFRIVSEAEQTAVHVSWLGMSCAEKAERLSGRTPVWDQEAADRMIKTRAGELLEDVIFSAEEGEWLKNRLREDEKAAALVRKKAEEGMRITPEDIMGEYVPVLPHMYRFVRKKDRGRPMPEGPVLNLAVAGWLLDEPEYSRRAAELILALLPMKWFEGPVCGIRESGFHHVCFTEEHLLSEVSLAASFLSGVFAEEAWERIVDKLRKTWSFVREKCREPGYRNYMNQGIVSCRGLMLGACLLQKLCGGYEGFLEETYQSHTGIVKNYLSENGHGAEGPGYFEYSFSTSVLMWHAYAHYKNCPVREVVPECFKRAGRYLEAMTSVNDRNGRKIPVNCTNMRKDGSHNTLLLVFMTMVCDFPEGSGYLLSRFAGEEIVDTASSFDYVFYAFYKGQIRLKPYSRPYAEEICMKEDGLAAFRKGNTKLLITAERNPLTGHYHEDRGGIVLESGGETLLPDLGTTSYANSQCLLMEKKEYHNLACPKNLAMTVESENGKNAAAEAAFPITDTLSVEDMETPEAVLFYTADGPDGYEFQTETGMLFGEGITGTRRGLLSGHQLLLRDSWTFPKPEELLVTFLAYHPWKACREEGRAESGRMSLNVRAEGMWEFETEEGMSDSEGREVYILRIHSGADETHEIETRLFWEREMPSPKKSAEENTAAFQALLDQGGTIRIEEPGVYDFEDTLMIGSHTHLIFGAGVKLRRASSSVGSFALINRGAFSGEYDTDITIEGLHLITNGVEARHHAAVYGLTGEVSFFRVKHLRIFDFTCLDLPRLSFGIHICTFEDVVIERLRVEGRKDAVHLGTGKKFVIRHGLFRTFDDPIALNAHDYAVANPQLGWIEDGLIEDCYDLPDQDTTGYFCRILAGAWCDWKEGMEIQNSDTVVSNGRVYRAFQEPDGTKYISKTQPVHETGMMTLDGINWCMVQEDVTYQCGCRNIHFKDIHLQKKREMALSIHFDHDQYSRSVYPGAEMPVQENLVFEGITMENQVSCLVRSITPVDTVKILNSSIRGKCMDLESLEDREGTYGDTRLLLVGNTVKPEREEPFIQCGTGRKCTLAAAGNLTDGDVPARIEGDVTVKQSDIPTEYTGGNRAL